MKKRRHYCISAVPVLLLSIIALFTPCLAGPNLNCLPVRGPAPGIDGIYNPVQWPTAPQAILNTPTYPIQTNVYCSYDPDNLYILVDALGDTTDDNSTTPCTSLSPSTCDECLLVFGDANQTSRYVAEVWGKSGAGGIVGTNTHFPAGAEVAIGFSGHRFYEWKIPLSSINLAPGQAIDFSSPVMCKGMVGVGDPCYYQASMPYDGSTGLDNGWPSGVVISDRSTWSTLLLGAGDPLLVPTLTEWGIITFIFLAGLGAVYYMRMRRRAEK